MKTYTIKPLEWHSGMAHVFDGETCYQIGTHPDGGWFSNRIDGAAMVVTQLRGIPYSPTEEQAKAACESDWQERVGVALVEVDTFTCGNCGWEGAL